MVGHEQRLAAEKFKNTWVNRGDEKRDSQTYWHDFLQDVLGMKDIANRVQFEKPVIVDGHTKSIDVFIPESRVLVEQKSFGIPLDNKQKQSDGELLTPYKQAKRYSDNLPFSEKPRWIIVSNFSEIRIHNMNTKVPEVEFETIALKDLPKEWHRFKFLVAEREEIVSREMELSVKAGDIIGKIYDKLLEQYADKTNPESLKHLNKLCVRFVFCMYAEDSGLFGNHLMFHDYMEQYAAKDWRTVLMNLFKVLDTKYENRDPYLEEDLKKFPYVNGGLFADENLEIPRFTEEIRKLVLEVGCGFDWSEISPTIFGALFESTLNPETRRSGGMHYTSIENIHKVIDPLFLDDLKKELEEIRKLLGEKPKERKLREFQKKLASATYLDPACGSGNFLTESYLSLRRLENQVLKELSHGQIEFGFEGLTPIQVSLSQFYGIEINDFAVTVAKTALWIAESQMMKETESIVRMHLDFLPLKSYTNIVEGNALRMDWGAVVPKEKLNYIMGNPPFIGASMMTAEQKNEAVAVFGKGKRVNSIDYVGAWYYKAAQLMHSTSIRAALVSTNSITQGEQVAPLWQKLFEDYNIHIDFAYRTFRWDSEASLKAHVHCVIIGFSVAPTAKDNRIYEGDQVKIATQINPYLVDAPTVFISSRGSPICDVPRMTCGNKPSDGGNLILSESEANELLAKDPSVKSCIRRYVGSRDYINSDEVRYCLWLKNVPPSVYRKNPEIMRRLQAVKEMRLKSSAAPTRALAEKPYIFFSTPQTEEDYLCIPEVSSERRKYIPIGFMHAEVIASNKLLIVPGATIYHFGILISNVHMAWMRAVTGRLKSDYQYSSAIVYNNFPWCNPSPELSASIEKTAQGILNARNLYPDSSLADLYDQLTMPPELRKAHQLNDKAVMEAYGFSKNITEEEMVANLLKMYKQLVEN